MTTGTETPTDSTFTLSSRTGTTAQTALQAAVKEKAALYDNNSYPLGDTLGCYDEVAYYTFKEKLEEVRKFSCSGNVTEASSATALAELDAAYQALLNSQVLTEYSTTYNALVSALDNVETLANSTTLTDSNIQTLLSEIAEAKKALDKSLVLADGREQTYNAYRDFEKDTVGSLIPYGIVATKLQDGGEVSIVSENGNKFLRLTTDSDGGYANMFLPYTGFATADANQNIVVEFSARFNADLRYANAFIAKNQLDYAAATIAFDNTGGAKKVLTWRHPLQ